MGADADPGSGLRLYEGRRGQMIRVGVGFQHHLDLPALRFGEGKDALRAARIPIGLLPAPSRMRDKCLVGFRRESQTLWYSIADARVETLLATLYQLYCKD